MTREQVKELLPFLQTFANGEPIQALCNNEWRDTGDDPDIDPRFCKYRVKPKETYRPFNNCKECWEEMQKHVPFGWIKRKNSIEHLYINYITNDLTESVDHEIRKELRICDDLMSFLETYNNYTFTDGTPFGIKETEE